MYLLATHNLAIVNLLANAGENKIILPYPFQKHLQKEIEVYNIINICKYNPLK